MSLRNLFLFHLHSSIIPYLTQLLRVLRYTETDDIFLQLYEQTRLLVFPIISDLYWPSLVYILVFQMKSLNTILLFGSWPILYNFVYVVLDEVFLLLELKLVRHSLLLLLAVKYHLNKQ